MALYRERQSRLKKMGNLQKVILYFFIGFFFGALFYYFFRKSFTEIFKELENNTALWKEQQSSFFTVFVHSLWNHGKYFALFWIFSLNITARNLYQIFFTVSTGVRNGFLLLFFLIGKGVKGILLYAASLFPHVLLLLPLYLFCFSWRKGKHRREHAAFIYAAILAVFLLACLLEVKGNLPLMAKLF
jgi:hypothetical protein